MRITVPVRFPQKKKWLEPYSWHRWRKQGVPSTRMASTFVEKVYTVEDVNEFMKKDSPLFVDMESIPSTQSMIDSSHPDWHHVSCQIFNSKGFSVEGVRGFSKNALPSSLFSNQIPGSHVMYNFYNPLRMAVRNYGVLKAQVEVEAKETAAGPSQPSTDEDQKKRENSARAVKFTLYALGVWLVGSAAYVFFVWGAPVKDRRGRDIKDEFSDLPFVEQYMKRAIKEVTTTVTYLSDPSREKLLPDPMKLPYHQPPYTVLIELTGVLVHPDWTYKTGWRFKKRPGVDYFLNHIAGYSFEVVVYTNELGFTAFPIIDALDGQNVVSYRLFRDSTKYQDGHHVKDLDRINRDLSKVIVIDCNGKSVGEHRNNAIILPKWNGNDDDRTLFDLVALLQTISSNDIHDVRLVLEHYAKFDDPIAEFREKQIMLAIQEKEALAKDSKNPNLGVSPSWLLNIFRKA